MSNKRKQERLSKMSDVQGMFDEFRNESDRASAILAAAYLEAQLGLMISNFLIINENIVQELLKPDQILGTFGAKIRLSYSMGLIEEKLFHDLKLIQKIRNRFAHDLHGLTFQDTDIASRCNSFKAQTGGVREPRKVFRKIIMLMIIELEDLAATALKERRTVRVGQYDLLNTDYR